MKRPLIKNLYYNYNSFNNLLFQVSVSLKKKKKKKIRLSDVTWLTTDINRLISCLSITHLDGLVVFDYCRLRSSLSPASSSSLVMVNKIEIHVSLSISTLTSLISHMEINALTFWSGCQVLNMDVNTKLPSEVSQNHLYHISDTTIHYITGYILLTKNSL